ncbi:GerW family sporulation protein [Desulforudis sp. 1088]|uniref:GerW family sporulation protein n=2 Tax=Candidatus Desulforudis TaxID=471826 RepID=UPI003CF1DD1E
MAEQHPIQGLMQTAMESIKEMVDVNTVIGDPVETPDGTIIIPISRVALGFAAGGSEFDMTKQSEQKDQKEQAQFPFGGGSGAGVSVSPVGFLVVGQGQVRLLPIDSNVIADRLIDLAPHVLERLDKYFKKREDQPEEYISKEQTPTL